MVSAFAGGDATDPDRRVMLRESPPSDPPPEEAFVGEPRSADPPLVASTQTSRRFLADKPHDRGRAIALGSIGALVALGVVLIVVTPRRAEPPPPSLAAAVIVPTTLVDAGVASPGVAQGEPAPAPRPPAQWRVSSLKEDPSVEVTEGSFGKRGLVATLTQAGIPRPEIHRLVTAFEGVHRIDHPKEADTFVVAKDRAKGSVVAFEYATSPLDVWQLRPVEEAPRTDPAAGDPRVVVRKLELFVEHRRMARGLVVGADLGKAITAAGFRSEIAMAVDDALEGHVDAGAIRAGVRLRVVATEDWVESAFVRVKVEAIEFVPKSATPLRVYLFERDPSDSPSSRRAPAPGFYDAKGKQPFRGQFRSPLPLARVTSRFNPKRMHPVLKVTMPHNGVDFGASTGTPVYAAAAGSVVTAGNGGPCGNMVEIDHGSGINTVYCHLKGFASGLHAGEKVEARQNVGFVGQTGRVTGPHLHFAVKKHGVFVDPLGLKMDGVRVLPPSERDAFARKRADLDAMIDGVLLPSAADVPEENDDKDLHAE